MTASERVAKKTPAALLPLVDDLLARSYGMGSPYPSDGGPRVLLDPTPYAVTRFREWIALQTPELRALYAAVFTVPPA